MRKNINKTISGALLGGLVGLVALASIAAIAALAMPVGASIAAGYGLMAVPVIAGMIGGMVLTNRQKHPLTKLKDHSFTPPMSPRLDKEQVSEELTISPTPTPKVNKELLKTR